MKKLIFYRSIQGSFTFKLLENSPLFLEYPELQNNPSVQVPLSISCGFQKPIDKESGMSVSLPEVDKILSMLHKSFSLLVFYDLADIFIKALQFMKTHSPDFKELVLSDKTIEISLKDEKYNLFIIWDKILKIDQVSTQPFLAKTKFGFQFSKEKDLEVFFKDELQNKLNQIKKLQSDQNPYVELKDLKLFRFQTPQSLNWIEI